jgi:hypothetical protein
MLHLIWYIIIGFIAGCVAKALMHIASVNHVDNRAWYRRLNCWRRGDSSIFPAKCRRPLPSRGTNRFHSWSDCSFVRLAQIQAANTSRVEKRTKAVQVTRPTKAPTWRKRMVEAIDSVAFDAPKAPN